MKITTIAILTVIGVIGLGVLGSALNLITIPWLKFDAQVQTNRDIVTKTYNADNALYNYHWFQERAGTITATASKAKLADAALTSFESSAGVRSSWSFEDKTEDARLRTVSLGLHSQYEDLVTEYNAKAGEVDRAMFVDGLPLFFNLQPY